MATSMGLLPVLSVSTVPLRSKQSTTSSLCVAPRISRIPSLAKHGQNAGAEQKLRLRARQPILATLSPNEPAERDSTMLEACSQAVRNSLLAAAVIAAVSGAPSLPAVAEQIPPCADVASYYASTKGLTGTALRHELHDVINNHKVYSYSQAWEALKVLDAADERDPVGSRDVVEIYTQKHVAKSLAADREGWNREHLWPRSYGLMQKEPEFSDLHNLRPADINVNSARGNKWFGECNDVLEFDNVCLRPANREAAPDTAATRKTWTPPSEMRGDIARALLYMDLRYDGRGDGSTYDLVLSDTPSVANNSSFGFQPVALAPPAAPATTPQAPATPTPPASSTTTTTTTPGNTPPSAATTTTSPGASTPPSAASTPGTPTPSAATPSTASKGASQTETKGNPEATSPGALAKAKTVQFPGPLPAWLNELHYDNIGKDENEFLEIITRPGVNPDDITVALYNGNDGKVYGSFKLSKFAPGSKIAGFAAYSLTFPTNGIQNGPADGVAVIQKTAAGEKVVQFVSYEGQLVALEGPAKGFKSIDIGVSENDKTPKGSSLGLSGKGKDYGEFKWGVSDKASPGKINAGQSVSS